MRVMSSKSGKAISRRRETNHPKIQWEWPVRVALAGIAVVLGCLAMQMQKRLETVQGEFQTLQVTTASLTQSLRSSDSEQRSLQAQLETADSKVEQLSKAIDASNAQREKWQTRLYRMQSHFERARESAQRMRQEVAESEKQIAFLKAKIDIANDERYALQAELQTAHSETKQLKIDLDSAQAELFEMESSLRAKQDKPKDTRGKPERSKTAKTESDSGSGTEGVSGSSLDTESPKPRHATLGPGPDGRDYLIRTLVFEASGETEIGKAAVAHVILNRKRSGRWGHKIEDVVRSPWQFEPWMTRRSEIEGLSRSDPRYVNAAEIADAVLAGHIPDPTAGATHFLNPVIVRKRRGGSLPSWADSDGQPIGRHVFYCPECGGSAPTQAAALQILRAAGGGSEG